MSSTPQRRRSFVEKVSTPLSRFFGIGSRVENNTQANEHQRLSQSRKERSLKDLKSMIEQDDRENQLLQPLEEKGSHGWFNPDTILSRKPKALQSSSLGHGGEHKREDFSELCEQLTISFNDKMFSDVIFKVGPQGRTIYGHRAIIGNRSLYFKGIFSKAPSNIIELEFSEFSPVVFEQVIQYLYSGQVCLKLDNVLDILTLAEKFSVKSLSVLCCDYIQNKLDAENVCMITQSISNHNCPRLYQHCLQFVDKTILSVIKSESFLDLSEQLLIILISRDELIIKPSEEISIFLAVLNWAKHNGNSSDLSFLCKFAERVLKHIRFPLMPKSDITNIVAPTNFITQELLMEAYKNHLVPQQSNHERFTPRLCNSRNRK